MDYSAKIKGVDLTLKTTMFEKQFESEKAHIKVGYAKLTFGEFATTDLIIMKDVENDSLWLAVKKAKGEKFANPYIPKENMEELNQLINEVQDISQDEESEGHIEWEIGGI